MDIAGFRPDLQRNGSLTYAMRITQTCVRPHPPHPPHCKPLFHQVHCPALSPGLRLIHCPAIAFASTSTLFVGFNIRNDVPPHIPHYQISILNYRHRQARWHPPPFLSAQPPLKVSSLRGWNQTSFATTRLPPGSSCGHCQVVPNLLRHYNSVTVVRQSHQVVPLVHALRIR